MEFKFDPNSTKNEGRWRLKDPKIFINYFRKKSNFDGISFVCGRNTMTNKIDIQAIRFNKSIWTEDEASIWWQKNKQNYNKEWAW